MYKFTFFNFIICLMLCLGVCGRVIAQPTIELFAGMNNQVQLQKNGYIYKNGMHYVVWSNGMSHPSRGIDFNTFDGFIKLSTSPDGLVWTTQNILSIPNGSFYHVMTVDNAGKIHIAFIKNTSPGFYGAQDGEMVYANNVSGTWTEISNLGNGTSLAYNWHLPYQLTWGADGKLRLYFTNSTGWYATGAPLQMRVWETSLNNWTPAITISALNDNPNGADSQRNAYLFSKIVAGKMQVYVSDAYRQDCGSCTPIHYNTIKVFEENPITYAYTQIATIPNLRHYTESIDGLFNLNVASNGLNMNLNGLPFFTLPAAEIVNYPYIWIDENSEFIVSNTGNQSRAFSRVTGNVINQITGQYMIPANGFQLIADNTSNPRRLYRFVNPTITAPSALTFVASGGNQSASIVTANCTGGWTAVSNQAWLTFSPASGVNGTANMTITATNNTGASRTGTITITGCNGAVVKVITITQDAVAAPCNQNYNWTTWQSFSGTSATGVINNAGQNVNVTMTSNFNFSSTPDVFNYPAFNSFTGNIPNTTVPKTTWAVGQGGVTTMCFSQTVQNPVLVLSSLGGGMIVPVTLQFSLPYTVVFDGGGMQYVNSTTVIGNEGFAVFLFPGVFDCVTIYSSTPEDYTNITWGLNPPLFPVNISGNPVSCTNVTLTATGGVTYLWNGGSSPNTATNTFNSSGTYILKVTDANGCSVTTSKTVTINPLPTLSFVGLQAGYCVTASAFNLQASPSGGAFTINNISATQFNPSTLGVGNHVVKYTYIDGNGCVNSKTQNVVVNPLPVLSFVGLNTSYCVSLSAFNLQASPAGGTFTINGNSATQFNPSVLGAGTHTVIYTYTDANSCTNTKSQSVVVNALPVLSFVGLNNAYCINANAVTLQATPSGGTFTINNISATQFNPSTLGLGTHNVVYTFTDANSCTNTKTQNVVVNPLPILSFVGLNTAYCVDASPFNLQASPSGGSFLVNNISATQFNPSVLGVGNYIVKYTFTDGNGCVNSKTQNVVVNPLPILNISGLNNAYCISANAVTLSATPSGGTFTINGNNVTQFNPSILGAGTHTVIYTFTDANSCTNTKTQNVVVNPLPVLSFVGLNNAYCINANAVILQATPSGGTFTINGNNATNFNPSILGAGTHNVIYTFTDANSCTNTKTQNVVVNPLPILSFVGLNTAYCVDANAFNLQASPSGGAFTINNISTTQFNPSTLGVGNHVVKYTFTDGNGCVNTTTQNVVINALPVLSFVGLNDKYCIDANVFILQANISGGVFKINNVTATQFNPSTLGAGTHIVNYTFTDVNSCTNTTNKSVVVNPLPVLSFVNILDRYCPEGASSPLQASPAGGTFRINNSVVTELNPNLYSVGQVLNLTYTFTDGNGCTNMITKNISILHPDFYEDNVENVVICPNPYSGSVIEAMTLEELQQFAAGGQQITFQWSNGSTTRTIAVGGSNIGVFPIGTYTVIARNQSGCHYRKTVYNISIECKPEIYVPTAFSPNGDNLNDSLEIFGGDIVNFKMTIYDRWGGIVYISYRLEDKWDGTLNGQNCPDGNYVWQLQYANPLKLTEVKKLQGVVTVIR